MLQAPLDVGPHGVYRDLESLGDLPRRYVLVEPEEDDRPTGVFQREYRFDDGPRWSTTIAEQRRKARYIARCFAQIRDFLILGRKPTLAALSRDPALELFDAEFELTLPGTIGENNADTVVGNNLTWELSFSDDAEALSATSTLGGSNSAFIIGGGAVVLVAAVGAGVAVTRRRKGKTEREAIDRAGI